MTVCKPRTDWAKERELTGGALSVLECRELVYWSGVAGAVDALEDGHYTGLSTLAIIEGLPLGSHLTTVDHHKGDDHAPAVRQQAFFDALARAHHAEQIIGIDVLFLDYREALLRTERKFSFVFYDAAHTPKDCEDFWASVYAHLEDDCLVLFDDAEWEEMQRLGEIMERAGFRDVKRHEFRRTKEDKRDPEAYTIAVYARGAV